MKFLDSIRKYFVNGKDRSVENVSIDRVVYSENGGCADVYLSNGVSHHLRTEKGLREIGVFD